MTDLFENTPFYSRPYHVDRQFTDRKHNILIDSGIYEENGLKRFLTPCEIKKYFGTSATYFDNQLAVDYIGISKRTGEVIFIQERNRNNTAKFSDYRDFTIRYRRKSENGTVLEIPTELLKMNKFIEQIRSGELCISDENLLNLKIDRKNPKFFLTYTFWNSDNTVARYIIVNLTELLDLINSGKIVPVEAGQEHRNAKCGEFDEENGIFYAPVIQDFSHTEWFVGINVQTIKPFVEAGLLHFYYGKSDFQNRDSWLN